MPATIADPVRLPCGLELKNRLVKASLAEQLSPSNHDPNPKFDTVYANWSRGQWGAILTGNVMVDERHCGGPGDLVLRASPSSSTVDAWKRYASACHASPDSLAFVQLNHPGRQSPLFAKNTRGFMEKALAPSAVPLDIGRDVLSRVASKVVFGVPKEMSVPEIKMVVNQFADGALFCAEVGFDGIQIHGAHGYLIAQFLSGKSNRRTDEYGGTATKRARFAVEVVKAVRARVPSGFAVGIKLNSADAQHAGSLEESLEQIGLIIEAGVDFLEISGGTYEDPQMMQSAPSAKSARTVAREAFFLDFAHAVRARYPQVTLMVTGGFRSRAGMQAALAEGACDIIGIGRPSVIHQDLPKNVLLNEKVGDEEAVSYLKPARLPWLLSWIPLSKVLGAGVETEYYVAQILAIAKGLIPIAPA